MANWSGVVVPIVVAVLALVGSIVIALVNNYIQSLNKPKIDVIIEPNGTKAVINLTNNGLAPATNLSLIIGPFKDFTNVTKKFGAADVIVPQLPKISQTLNLTIPEKVTGSYLELRIPNLPHGEGSVTQIEVTNGTSNETFSDYKSAAVFDQGSSMGRKPLSPDEERDREPPYSFFGGYSNFWNYYVFALLYGTGLMLIYSNRLRKRILFKRFISYIRDQMTDIHSSLEEDQETKKNIHKFIETWKNKTPNLNRFQYIFFPHQ